METYVINNILYYDDYLTKKQITIKPILRKLLMFRMWNTTLTCPVCRIDFDMIFASQSSEYTKLMNFGSNL